MKQRSKFPLVVAGLALGVLVATTSATGNPAVTERAKPKRVFMTEIRSDIVDFLNGTVVPGAVGAAQAPSGNLFFTTASIQVRKKTVGKPAGASFRSSDATGGGEYAIRQGTTTVDAGAWSVKGATRVSLLGGTFAGTTDGIGHVRQATGGRIQVTVHLVPNNGAARDAILTLDCRLGGSSSVLVEGFKITDGSVTYSQFEEGAATLIHRWKLRVK